MNRTAAAGRWPGFSAAQWQELEHQALIYKYLTAGVPIPPELLVPIRRNSEALPARHWHYPELSYYPYHGKKPDPEPGRCRRTDGKKWRCSKDAHPDSKYCERHMHRGRNRSRKSVESQSQSQSASQLQSSFMPVTPAASGVGGRVGGNLQSMNPRRSIAGQDNAKSLCLGGSTSSQLAMGAPFVNSYFSGAKRQSDERSLFIKTAGNSGTLGEDAVDSSWCLVPSRVSSFPLKASDPRLQSAEDLGWVIGSSTSRQQPQQHSFAGCEFSSSESIKHEKQFLLPFLDKWPKPRDSCSDIDNKSFDRTSILTTQLSVSFPQASLDNFIATSSMSPSFRVL